MQSRAADGDFNPRSREGSDIFKQVVNNLLNSNFNPRSREGSDRHE